MSSTCKEIEAVVSALTVEKEDGSEGGRVSGDVAESTSGGA